MEETYRTNNYSTIYIVAGLLYGDEGKGTTVEYIVKRAKSDLVVRFNGGPQAAHHIVLEDRSLFHCFSQFSSGSFFPQCHTLLSKYMLISPHTMIREANMLIEVHNLVDIWDRMHIDLECFIITPYHQMINRISEVLRGHKNHGTTGLGVGVCADEAFMSHPEFFPLGDVFYNIDTQKFFDDTRQSYTTLQVKDLFAKNTLQNKINKIISEKVEQAKRLIKRFDVNSHFNPDCLELHKIENDEEIINKEEIVQKANQIFFDFISNYTSNSLIKFYTNFVEQHKQVFCNGFDFIKEKIKNKENIVFEGAQGALLDRVYGIFPHLTKTVCSDLNAMKLLEEIKSCSEFKVIKIGVLRAYSSRHGNGPFITHNKKWSELLIEEHNKHSQWQGEFKVGPFDFVGAKYGIEIFKPDYLSITCLDKILNVVEYDSNSDRNMEEASSIKVCNAYKISGNLINEELKNILENKKLFSFKIVSNEEEHPNYIIKNIIKRKIEEAYCSLDLLRILKFAEMEEKEIKFDQYKFFENSLFSNNEYKEKLVRDFNLQSSKINQISQYLEFMEKELETPIIILSFGPTHNDKITNINDIFI